MSQWRETKDVRPPEGVVVEAMDSGGHTQELMLKGNLWWFPDESMYVYYTPVRWLES